jgi:hypothetical protein
MQLRHEVKHYINVGDFVAIRSRLSHLLRLDEHARADGTYTIRSLYFDDSDDRVLLEKINGLDHRTKFRIRFYNGDASFIRLEKKTRDGTLCTKQSTSIARDQCERIMGGDTRFLGASEQPLFADLYAHMGTALLRPRTIVDYVREAYVFAPGDVRVTFDTSVRTGLSSTDLFEGTVPTVETLDRRYVILEVKYKGFLPDIVGDMIQTNERRASAVSKYALCRMFGL